MKQLFGKALLLLTAISLLFLAYRGFGWWQDHQKRKALFVYFQQKSPVTRKMPNDTITYLNLYDINGVYGDVQGSNLYKVITHWLDTGMAENEQANSLLGGMMEKTILNVIGSEFGLALLPSGAAGMDALAIARLRPASDFVLRLALSASKNARRIDYNGETIYAFITKNADYPEVFVFIGNNFAYASSNIERLKNAKSATDEGPDFLKELEIQALPQDTFLFLQSQDPKISLIGYGRNRQYHLRSMSGAQFGGTIPQFPPTKRTVLSLNTNGTVAFGQPPAAFVLQTASDTPATGLLFDFAEATLARDYRDSVIASYTESRNLENVRHFNDGGVECWRYLSKGQSRFICSKETTLLLAFGKFPLNHRIFGKSGTEAETDLPLTLLVNLNQEGIQDYRPRVESGQWDRFSEAQVFYFLSCIASVEGGIDKDNDTITVRVR